jgi:hypothetical protein
MTILLNEVAQKDTCIKFGANYLAAPLDLKVGIAPNVKLNIFPINGLRHPPNGDTTGWFIWGGEELSQASDFFQPLHVQHIDEWCPDVSKYLGLAPGWRFMIAPDFEDVWFDESLLSV